MFAGQREDPFFGDIGAIFDLVTIRKGTGATGGGKDFFAGYAVHSIALQIPIADARHVEPRDRRVGDDRAAVGEGRREAKARKVKATKDDDKWVQVSRLGNPLVNEVLIPTELKDKWNSLGPDKEQQFARYYREPILAKLLNQLYPQFGPFQETGPRRPRAGAAHRRPRLEQHRLRSRRRAAAQPVDPGDGVAQPPRRARQRPRRVGRTAAGSVTTSSTSRSGRSAVR